MSSSFHIVLRLQNTFQTGRQISAIENAYGRCDMQKWIAIFSVIGEWNQQLKLNRHDMATTHGHYADRVPYFGEGENNYTFGIISQTCDSGR